MRAHDVIRLLSRDGRPTPLGDAIAHYGRIPKTLHILRMADEPTYRREIKPSPTCKKAAMPWPGGSSTANAATSTSVIRKAWRTSSARWAWSSTPWCCSTPRYMDAALVKLRLQGFVVRDEDVVRLSPFIHAHVNMPGRYSYALSELPGGLRTLGESVDIHPDLGIGG